MSNGLGDAVTNVSAESFSFAWTTHTSAALVVVGFWTCVILAGALVVAFALGASVGARYGRRRAKDVSTLIRQLNDETADGSVLKDGTVLRKMIGHLPKWIKYSDVDRVPWLNKAARQMWPSLDKAIATSVIESLEPTLNDLAKTTGLSLNFKKFTCGVEPPIFASVKVSTESEAEVILDIEFKWAAKESSVILDVSTLGIKLPIELRDVEAYGTFRIVFGPLVPWWPSFSALKLAFVDKPEIDFSLKLIGGDITAVPVVANMLRDLIKNQLVDLMVWPSRLWCAATDWQPDEVAHSSGLLRVTVRSASNLPSKLASKPAVEVSLTQRADVKRVTTAKRGSDPVWEETFEFTVADIHSAKLRLNVIETRITTQSVVSSTLRAPSALLNRGSVRGMSSKYDGEDVRNKPSLGQALCDVSLCHDTPSSSVHMQVPLTKPGGNLTALSLAAAPIIYGANLAKRAVTLTAGSSPRASGPRGFNSPDGPAVSISVSYHPFNKKVREDAPREPSASGSTKTEAPIDARKMMEQFSGVLYVRLLRGENLASVGESPDPFVKLRMNRQKRKSSTKLNTRQPVWEEEFEFIVGEQELANSSNILLEVWDRDAFGVKTSLGRLELDTRAVLSRCTLIGTPVEEVFELTNTPSGSLTFEFEFLSVLLHPEVKQDVTAQEVKVEEKQQKLEKKGSMMSRMFSRKKNSSSKTDSQTTLGSPINKQTRSTPVPTYVESADSPLIVAPRSPMMSPQRSKLNKSSSTSTTMAPALTEATGKRTKGASFAKRVRSGARSTMRAFAIKKPDEGGNKVSKKDAHGLLSPRRQPTDAKRVVPGLEWRQRGINMEEERPVGSMPDAKDVNAFETPSRHKRSASVPELFLTPRSPDDDEQQSKPPAIAKD